MKPRIFVSSTYYDLKYIRNNIERFIAQYGFEPVLFESGSVFFRHGEKLDISCYNEIKLCHTMILIIGGRYGTTSSEENNEEFIDSYERSYISITRKEFRQAVSSNIPVFIFIDKNVYAEYHTYKRNKDLLDRMISNTDNSGFNFAHVDSKHIFDFIDEVKVKALVSFEKFEDIEEYLKNQWAGMFYNYLSDLKVQKDNEEILNSVTELQNISDRMNEMIGEIGKTILSTPGQYEDAVKKQNEKTIILYIKKIIENINFNTNWDLAEGDIFEISQLINDYILNHSTVTHSEFLFLDNADEIKNEINNKLRLVNKYISIESMDLYTIADIYKKKIKPLFNYEGIESFFKESLEKNLEDRLLMPF